MKRIVLCADDYGQAYAISKGIVTLIQEQRLSATSCMVNSPYWLEHAEWLKPFINQVDIGLHFNLTEGKALSETFIDTYGEDFHSLAKLLGRSLVRNLDQEVIEAECDAQIDRFIQGMQRLPCFIDGHQHVQQFPIIRDAMLNVYEQRLRNSAAYVRLVTLNVKPRDLFFDIKKLIIYLSGTKAFKRLLQKKLIPHNTTFTGIYSFKNAQDYPQLFSEFLSTIEDNGIVMCHPGLPDNTGIDPIEAARSQEYQFLTSPEFLKLCADKEIVLTRFSWDGRSN